MDKIIKIGLAILFFLCLADMPYGYYQLVRFAGLIGFAILAYQSNQRGRQTYRNDNLRWTCFAISTAFQNRIRQRTLEYC